MSIPGMRTVHQCSAYLKEQEPECCVGEWCIRQIVNQGKIPVVRSGLRFLIYFDTLVVYLSGGSCEEVSTHG